MSAASMIASTSIGSALSSVGYAIGIGAAA